jgi:hypothetical protein
LAVAAQESHAGGHSFTQDSPVWLSWSKDSVVLLPKQ